MSTPPIEKALCNHKNSLLSISGVVGVGHALREGHPCIRVFVEQRTREIIESIPKSLDGYPVHILATGRVEPHLLN